MNKLKNPLTYLVPIALIIVTTFIKLNFTNELGSRTPYLLYTGVVIISTWYSGWLIGVISNFVCLILIDYFFLEPIYSLGILPRLYLQMSVFSVQNGIIAAMGYTMTKAIRRSKEAEMKYKLLVEQTSDLLVLRDAQYQALYVSARVTPIYGYTQDEYKALPLEKLIAPDFLDYYRQNISEIINLPNGHRFLKFQYVHKSGELGWMEGDVYNHLEQPGINALVLNFKDVTQRVTLENQKDEFLSIASHELKTPLTSIKAFNQLMHRTTDPARLQGFIQKSTQHISRLERLISDLLDVTKINAGKINYNMQPFSFKHMLQNCVENIQHTAHSHQIILESVADVEFTGDQFRLEQVVNNFLTNAIKYSPAGQRVLINSKVQGDNLVVSVQDFGIGIAHDHLDRLFDRYYRVDNTAMRFEGLGLGLFISSEILKRHKGDFWIESEQGKGSTFYFRLPLVHEYSHKPAINTPTFYQDSTITITYNQTHHRLDVDWTGFQNVASVKSGGMIMLEMLKRHHCNKVVNDNTHVQGTWSEAAEWVGQEWFPMMEQAGLKYFAWIFSSSTFSQLSAKKSVDIKQSGIISQFFTDIHSAQEWIDGK